LVGVSGILHYTTPPSRKGQDTTEELIRCG
jgi:hypothetical protein